MKGLEQEVVDQILDSCEEIKEVSYISDEQKQQFQDLNLTITDEFSINHIPVTIRIPLRILNKSIKTLVERLSRLADKEVSKTIYRKIGFLEIPPVNADQEPLVLLFAACLVEPKHQHLSEQDLHQIIMDDDEPLREDDQDWI